MSDNIFIEEIKKSFASLVEDQDLVCLCGDHYECHALDELWEDGSCRIFGCNCEKYRDRL